MVVAEDWGRKKEELLDSFYVPVLVTPFSVYGGETRDAGWVLKHLLDADPLVP